MRKIILEKNNYYPWVITVFVFGGYFFIDLVRNRLNLFFLAIFLVNFVFAVLFFPLFFKFLGKDVKVRSFWRGFSYSLLPLFIWFCFNVTLHFIFPPPHYFSFLGLFFSFAYLTIFLTVLGWELILIYLTVRFASRANFFQIIFTFIVYLGGSIFLNLILNDLTKLID